MKALAILVALLIAVTLLAAACGGEESRTETAVTLTEGDVAPDFSLPGADGEATSLQDFKGEESVLLYFSMGSG